MTVVLHVATIDQSGQNLTAHGVIHFKIQRGCTRRGHILFNAARSFYEQSGVVEYRDLNDDLAAALHTASSLTPADIIPPASPDGNTLVRAIERLRSPTC